MLGWKGSDYYCHCETPLGVVAISPPVFSAGPGGTGESKIARGGGDSCRARHVMPLRLVRTYLVSTCRGGIYAARLFPGGLGGTGESEIARG